MNAQLPDQNNTRPLRPVDIQALLKGAPFHWWIAGGWALDLFLGKETRPHFDIDVAIARQDQLTAQSFLRQWDFWSTMRLENGEIVLCHWENGEVLGKEIPGCWARETPSAPWRFEFLMQEIADRTWTFRYADVVQHGVDAIGAITVDDIPYLQPEIVLLTKALRRREVDEQDFSRALPKLNRVQCEQLLNDIQKIQPDHSWLAMIKGFII